MFRMRPAARTEFLDRKLLGLLFFIAGRRVIPPLAPVALKSDQITHLSPFLPSDAPEFFSLVNADLTK